MAFRPKILALANKITLEARTGIPNVPSDPEYRILNEVVTDEQAEVALACKVRQALTLEEIAKKCGKPLDVTKKLLWELGDEGVIVFYTDPADGIEYYYMPCWVPGIMEMMVGNKAQVEAHPEIARCFDEYTLRNMKLMTPNLPRGMGVMRVIPVQKAIDLNRQAVSSDQLSRYIEGAWKIVVTDCSCRRTRRAGSSPTPQHSRCLRIQAHSGSLLHGELFRRERPRVWQPRYRSCHPPRRARSCART